ncbi:hypothetical protein [Longimicrobium terrae]|uniref:DNA-binding MarR family transcriptional regulator n=1 Tax=Longimicrobium terrae TaxID=1639882 RepID=A0A841H375_9BACT|nr:hypothetical protein [Longimicrobium terrae]MBB4638380.1 DNA-binding MarR family transcriptional regulator [Longimicrobium terrae]MBB6072551.1 DNA-binding MarR family transcriptional regulator [Longimicrobium terrae]NNC28669.1 hypothetical protein [Longimicrobium terrae]
MSDELSPAEMTVLRDLARRGNPMSEVRLDTEALVALAARRFVRRISGFAVITPEGQRAFAELSRPAAPAPIAGEAPAPAPEAAADGDAADGADVQLNETQEDMVRQLALANADMPFDDLDGRVVRALEGRGLVQRMDGLVSLTDAGRRMYEERIRRRRRARTGWVGAPAPRADVSPEEERSAPEKAIREAVDVLRGTVPGEDNIMLGDLEAPAEDAFKALLELADRIERGDDPRRIRRR